MASFFNKLKGLGQQVMGSNDPNSEYVKRLMAMNSGKIAPIVGAGAGGYKPVVQQKAAASSISPLLQAKIDRALKMGTVPDQWGEEMRNAYLGGQGKTLDPNATGAAPSVTQTPMGIDELIKQFSGSGGGAGVTTTPASTSTSTPTTTTPAASPGGLKLSSWTTKAQLPAGQRNRVWF